MSKAAQRVQLVPSNEEGSSKVKVLVRIRPFLGNEIGHDKCVLQLEEEDSGHVFLQDPRRPDGALQFSFDHVYGSTASQEDIFKQEIEPSLSSLFKGLNTTIFCTGMTGAGKTHTMQGTRDDPGLIPRVIKSIMDMSSKIPSRKVNTGDTKATFDATGLNRTSTNNASESAGSTVTMSYFEIYNEKVFDLLEPKDLECPVREDLNRKIVIAGLKEAPLNVYQDFTALFELGLKNRKTAATKLNHVSSRSHALLMLKVRSFCPKSGKPLEAKLHLIDLAGNEDNRKTDNRGARMTESVNINSSLLALAKVVQALNDGEKRIPYRESKLTRLLQDSLGGHSVGIMIANVAPGLTHFLNTYNTLNFATKSRQVINNPQVNSPNPPTSSSSSYDLSSTSPESAADRRRLLDQWKEGKSRSISSTSLKLSTTSNSSGTHAATSSSSSSSSPGSSASGDTSSQLRSELLKLQMEHQQYKAQKQAQAKINESYLLRIAQLEKALLDKQSDSVSSSLPSVIPPSSSTPLPGDATPCTKTKLIHQKIAKAKNLETLDPTEALQVYSDILSNLRSCGSDYKEVSAKVQARIDKLLAQCMDAQDRLGALSSTATTAKTKLPSATTSSSNNLSRRPAGSGSSNSSSLPSAPKATSSSIATRQPFNTTTTSTAVTRDVKQATAKSYGVSSSAANKPSGILPLASFKSASSGPAIARTLFTDKENSSPNMQGVHVTLNMKKRRPSTSIESEDDEGLGTGYDSEEAYIVDDEAGESDISIEETPVKRPPTKKRKVANGAASAAGSESEKEEYLAKNLISQELEVLNAPYQQEIDGILHVLNSYDVKRITTLHGIGKVRAEQIVERSKASPFSSLEQLVHAGLGPKLIVTFVRRNIVEAVYFKKTATAPGSSIQRPLLVEI